MTEDDNANDFPGKDQACDVTLRMAIGIFGLVEGFEHDIYAADDL